MIVVILQSSPHGNIADGASDALLASAAGRLGHDVRLVGISDDPCEADILFPRADLRSIEELTKFADAVRAFERLGAACHPTAAAMVTAENKALTHEALARAGVLSVPTTVLAASDETPLFEYPVVVKPPVDWGGRGVLRCNDATELADARARMPASNALIQPLVVHRRCVTVQVVGDRAVAAFSTRPVGDDFRSNARLGGRTTDLDLSAPALRSVADHAVRAINACGLTFGSVDLLDPSVNDGDAVPMPVIEVNSIPGLWPHDPWDRAFAEALVRFTIGGAE